MSRGFVRFFSLAFVTLLFALPPLVNAQSDEKADADWIDAFRWRELGPANMSGRIVALAVYEQNPSIYWAATASGGLLKTTNRGITFEHQFDRESVVSIGDVAVFQGDPNIVWVGTGEANPRNSVSYGNGVYKSTDGGETWKHLGLESTFQTGRIALHPTDPNIAYIGALGRLYGPNEDRGLYKTTDGGETWDKILYIDDKTGIIDVKMSPANPDELLVATYERRRDGFDGNDPEVRRAPGSGIYRTTDGGASFARMTEGLPTVNLGRMAFDYYRKDPGVVWAIIESELTGEMPEDAGYCGISLEESVSGPRIRTVVDGSPAADAGLRSGDLVVSVQQKTIESKDDVPPIIGQFAAGAKVAFEITRRGEAQTIEVTLGEPPAARERAQRNRGQQNPFTGQLGGQRENMQDRQGPKGFEHGGIYRSADGGVSWTRVNSLNPRPMYFSHLRVDPNDENHLFVCGISMYRSKDGGKEFTADASRGVHADQHALWINPNDGAHILLGCDGGVYQTYDRADTWEHLNHVAIGQFYHVAVDQELDYRVYGGLQDNGTWGGPSRLAGGARNEDWINIGGGDGFRCAIDPNDPNLIYFESQNGATGRRHLVTGERASVRARPEDGERYRYNWNTPFILSDHNSRIYYNAGNYVFRSLDRGNDLKRISPEITLTDQGSATALSESPRDADVLYVGSDDGAIWGTRNGGYEWTRLYPSVDPVEGISGEPAGQPEQPQSPGGEAIPVPAPPADVQGEWNGRIDSSLLPPEAASFLLAIELKDGSVRGRLEMGDAMHAIESGTWNASSGELELQLTSEEGNARLVATVDGKEMSGSIAFETLEYEINFTAEWSKELTGKAPTPQTEKAKGILTGEWDAQLESELVPAEQSGFVLTIEADAEGGVKGRSVSDADGSESEIVSGKWDRTAGTLEALVQSAIGEATVKATVDGAKMTGVFVIEAAGIEMPFSATRISGPEADPAPERDTEQEPEEAEPETFPLDRLIPGPRWVSSTEASRFAEGRVYITLDGHRSDDDAPYVFVSEDYGQTWRSLRGNLPVTSTRAIREDIENENLLYLGTEFGAYASIDRGKSWVSLNTNLPTVAVHDFAQNRPSGDVVAATHGRSLWAFDATVLRQVTPRVLNSEMHLFQPNEVVLWRGGNQRGNSGGTQGFSGSNGSSTAQIFYYLSEPTEDARLVVQDLEGNELSELEMSTEAGLHRVSWNLRQGGNDRQQGGRQRRGRRTAGPGTYRIVLETENATLRETFEIIADPEIARLGLSAEQVYENEAEAERLAEEDEID
ncbi:MAG: PDZ domain-containing protein [Planctomycetota bacterium]